MLEQADAIQELREFAQSTNISIATQSVEIDKDIEGVCLCGLCITAVAHALSVAAAHFDRSIAEVDDFETRLLKQLDDIEFSISTAMEQGSDDIAARASGWRWPFIGVLALACCIGFVVTKRVKREFRRTSLGGL